jgi:hypothetical protein
MDTPCPAGMHAFGLSVFPRKPNFPTERNLESTVIYPIATPHLKILRGHPYPEWLNDRFL